MPNSPIFCGRAAATGGLLAVLGFLASSARVSHGASPVATPVEGRAAVRTTQLANAALVAAVTQSPQQAVEPTTALHDATLLARAEDAKERRNKASTPPRRPSIEVLMIGDSMTVGGFGDSLQEYLYRRYTSSRVALYASCGSSPEHWLKGEPDYVTKCGYKAQTPQRRYYTDFEGHRPPTPTVTPKIEDLLAFHQPSIVIVQLGTNWMDSLEVRSTPAEHQKYVTILNRFAAALRSARSVKQVIWITPPDSSRYSAATEKKVSELIRETAKKNDYTVINSASMTHYTAGKTGGDGVHYRKEDALAWAESVQHELRGKLR